MKKNILVSVMALVSVLPVSADTAVALTDSSRVYDLDEVVVISQAKEFYRLRQQPLSSTVLSGDNLLSLGVRDIREVSDFVPSFVMPNYGSRFTSSIYVRGIGSRVNSPSMGVYIDDMPMMNKTAFNSHLYQVDRVDVLRGPQGTLYGLNTEGGMVRMYSRNPFSYQGTDVNLGLGTGFYRNVEVAHYNKVSDRFAFSLAAFYDGQTGFFRNVLADESADDMDEAGARLRLMYRPTRRLSFDLIADYQFVRQKAYPYFTINTDGDLLSSPNQDAQSNYKRNMLNVGLGVKYQGEGFDIHSNTSWQFLRDNLLMDNDYSDIDFIVVDQFQLGNVLTQEFSVKSNNKSAWHWTTGVFGSYQWLKTVAPNTFGAAFSGMMSQQVGGMIYQQMLNSMAQRMGEAAAAMAIERAGGVNVGMTLFVPCNFHTPQANLGIFHESNLDITEHLTATLGLRYDLTHSKIHYITSGDSKLNFDIMGAAANATVLSLYDREEETTFSQLLPKVGLIYKFNHGSNIYATVTKGYRAGGFNVQMFGDIIQSDVQKNLQGVMMEAMQTHQDVNSVVEHTEEEYAALLEGVKFKPEESWNYEVGTHLNLFDHALQADLSAFYMQIRNQQLSVFTAEYGFGRRMVNAGKSFSCGVEATLRGSLLNDRLTWNASYGYTHAVFKEYETSAKAGSTDIISYKDNKVPFVPAHTYSAAVDYRIDSSLSDFKSLTFGVNMNGQGKLYWNEENSFCRKGYVLFGAHVLADFGLCKVNLWARNIGDVAYQTFAFSSKATGQEKFYAQLGNPFQMGVDINFHF
ncbi:MAG: TonB-dependent receptor [Prevotella sp.]|nr:TonB-dependent receptor [Prevotella sp.]